MEASTLQQPGAPRVLRLPAGPRLLRLRSNDQLVSLFRAGEDDAFGVIHDRHRGALLTYVRHVLGASNADAEDVLQDVFVRAYRGLRAHDRPLNLSPWLYRVARNACIDELRRRLPIPYEEMPHSERQLDDDPVHAESIQRERVRRLISDLQRLPEQQRSALLLCELSGMSYADVAEALGTSVSAVKSLLVRARLGLAQLLEARETACSEICDELASAHAHGARPNALVRRHLHDCQGCRQYARAMHERKLQLAALAPTVAPLAALAKLFGGGAGSGAGAGAAAAGGAGGAGAASGGVAVSAGVLGVSGAHVLTVLAASTIVAAGAVGIKEATATHTPAPPSSHVRTPYEPAAQPGTTAATVPASLRADAAARAAIHHVVATTPKPALGSGGTSPSRTAAPVTTPASTATPAPTSQPTTSKSSSSSCPIGQQSCDSTSQSTATTTPGTSTGAASHSQSPLGSGGTSTSTSGRPADTTSRPIGANASGAAPPTSGPPASPPPSSPPLGSSTSPPLGS